MVDTIQPRSLCSFRTPKRRHDHRMNRPRTKNPRASQHYMGWKTGRIFVLLPVAGDVFLLTFPFIERGYRKSTIRQVSDTEENRAAGLPIASARLSGKTSATYKAPHCESPCPFGMAGIR